MKKIYSLLFALLAVTQVALAQSGSVRGRVLGADTREPLTGATVLLEGTTKGASTNAAGEFSIMDVPAGTYNMRISYVGYTFPRQSITVSSGGTTDIGTVTMNTTQVVGEEIVVTASRRPEKLTEAPAAISVISTRDLTELPSFNVGELLNKVQGVEVVRSGVAGIGINARGFNNAFNVKMFQLTDGRNSMLPGGTGLPAGVYNTVIKEDIERVEVILGPSSALYGPNAHNGIINTITKDPRRHPGTTVTLGAGNQSVLSARARHAGVINSKFAYKVNAEYTQGKDFEFIDTVYNATLGALPEYDVDFNFNFKRASAAVYYSPTQNMDVILDYGIGQGSNIGVTNNGRNQIDGWTFQYLHGRIVTPRIFAQVYNTWNDAGDTYQINARTNNYYTLRALGQSQEVAHEKSKTGAARGELYPNSPAIAFPGFIDKSHRLNGEVQYNNSYGGFDIVTGLSFQRDVAYSRQTYLDDRNGDIILNQYGAVAQIERGLGDRVRAVVGARLDRHDNYGTQFSPKAALTLNALAGTFRATYGRAYAAPSIQFQEFYLNNGALAILGSGAGLTIQNTETGATREIPKLEPERVQTFELGYKGTPTDKFYVDLSTWYSMSEDFISPLTGITPIMGKEKVIRKGTEDVTEAASNALNYYLTYLNYGNVNSWGTDLGLNYYLNNNFSVGAKYSYFNSDITDRDNLDNDANGDGKVVPAESSLNAPKHRYNFNFTARDLFNNKFFGSVNVRILPEYDFYSGSQVAAKENANKRVAPLLYNYGPLGGFTSVDVSAGYRFTQMITLGASVSNLFNTEQREFVGSPVIGRLYSAELRFDFGGKKDKNDVR
ncbi:TonB-dependent receptor [Pontibacter virosus]|uniref:Iron complex outermembrane receptor protein n=1 Tax=Pontibacter virosus TaxID=1765052 RepID=A0A2U1AU89_9BACT|nr:TonB-dependent receptor [Pontibacter virosus]PVY39988.1 iron complex outermembrane receptor protein [Pontibacter virosus]